MYDVIDFGLGVWAKFSPLLDTDTAARSSTLTISVFLQHNSFASWKVSIGGGQSDEASLVHAHTHIKKTKTPWPESASELYRPSDRRLLAKLVPSFADRGCHVVNVTDPYGRILGFLDWHTHIQTRKIWSVPIYNLTVFS
jgi:hypothetical protein